jgi:uncharacterized protein
MRYGAAVLTLLVALGGAGAALGQWSDLPQVNGWVNDTAGVLTERERQRLLGLCTDFERETGAEMVVVTVASLQGEPISDYAHRLGNAWGVGKRGKNNGVVLLLAVQEQQTYIAYGDGLQSALTSDNCTEILDRFVQPSLRRGRYGDGLYAGAKRIARTVANASADVTIIIPPSRSTSPANDMFPLVWLGLISVVLICRIGIWVASLRQPWWKHDDAGWGWGSGSGWFPIVRW